MINIENKEQINRLLGKKVPSYRQAYSDRTSWVMACLSEISYIRFNSLFSKEAQRKTFEGKIVELVGKISKSHKKSFLNQLITKQAWSNLIDTVSYDSEKEREKMISILENLNLKLLKTFDENGTQAILVQSESFITLAFRGTESSSWKDIKTDINAVKIQSAGGGKVHQGFHSAFEKVYYQIQEELNKDSLSDIPLFITGHSLGGALAVIATKRLQHGGGIAACYTFGSPRVADEKWFESVKTPIYRVINSADMVPSVPFGGVMTYLLKCFFSLIRMHFVNQWVQKIGGYYHGGDMKYLTNSPAGNFQNVRLLNYYSFWRRAFVGVMKKTFRTLASDHRMKVYRKKLLVIALRRNDD